MEESEEADGGIRRMDLHKAVCYHLYYSQIYTNDQPIHKHMWSFICEDYLCSVVTKNASFEKTESPSATH